MTAPTRSTRGSRRAPERTPDPTRRTRTADTDTVAAPTKPTRADRTSARPRTPAAERAYARRAQREGRGGTRSHTAPAVKADEATSGRASFVVLIIALLVVGVVATLWLTTQAIADSYRLEAAKQEATRLSEQAAQLQREVTKQESPSALADRARALGMVPAGDPSWLVVNPDGSVTVVGDAKPVTTPPSPNAAAQPSGAQPPAGQSQSPDQGSAQNVDAGTQPPAGQAAPEAGAQTPPGGGG
ncbi:hypothetical protein [Actinokineospora iranica]|uniref:Septum formation initiator n=1 Tax=Actinokineospora iranica TaxID=1271860 RepID=A0A1G6KGB4_9PSEU|nr:hypothetical protein [Actinokineospora iranica]SDC29888.1 hypothetical protein SAMN05216174_101891 [Actinokineospora iranica]